MTGRTVEKTEKLSEEFTQLLLVQGHPSSSEALTDLGGHAFLGFGWMVG